MNRKKQQRNAIIMCLSFMLLFLANITPIRAAEDYLSSNLPREAITVKPEALVVAPSTEPPDISGHWAYYCVTSLLREGLIKGYADGTIHPDQEITRAEAARLLVNSLGLTGPSHTAAPYTDELPAWAREEILLAYDKGLMKGYPDRTFKPDQPLTRAEMCVLLGNASLQGILEDFDLSYANAEDIPEWVFHSVKTTAVCRSTIGYPHRAFHPQEAITRADMFSILFRLKVYNPEH